MPVTKSSSGLKQTRSMHCLAMPCSVREVTSRLLVRNGVEWGLKGGELGKNAFEVCIEFSVPKPFMWTCPGGQNCIHIFSVKVSWYKMNVKISEENSNPISSRT